MKSSKEPLPWIQRLSTHFMDVSIFAIFNLFADQLVRVTEFSQLILHFMDYKEVSLLDETSSVYTRFGSSLLNF